MVSRTSIKPPHTNVISSSRLCRTTGTSFSTLESRSKNWCRLRQMKTPANRKTITTTVNPTRSVATPWCSISAIISRIVGFHAKTVTDTFHLGLRRVREVFRCHLRNARESPFGGKSPGNRLLVAFRGEDGFWIGAGNFAHRDPANAADQRAD